MRSVYYIICGICLYPVMGFCSTQEFMKSIQAFRSKETIQIDGVLSESVWQQAGVSAFFQKEPNQGEPVSEPTEVWVAYDDVALYIAANLRDHQPDSIIARLARRDYDVGSDEFFVEIDSYHDHRNAYYFGISAAGTLKDGILYNDDWSDNSWDGVWEAQQRITSDGWTVEMRIPFSQLRFEERDRYVWGINFERIICRKKEEAFLVYTPRNESGFVSRFPDLVGIDYISPPSRFEVTPYITGRAEYLKHERGDPFHSGSDYEPDVGCDFKLGIGSNLTLNGTVNPDFGQVEVDPAIVNLSDVETYYQEKRPFFVEGMNIFSFGQGGVNSFWNFNWSQPNLFYTRRIGRAPQRGLPDYDFADIVLSTHILGAAKLTGKIFNGWNIGVVEALTKREYAELQENNIRQTLEAEPMASYSVGRVQKDFNNGGQGLGILTTYTRRFFDDQSVRDDINEDALVAGIDGWTSFDAEKEYMISGWTSLSYVRGTKDRMIALQRSSSHYFQRPDADYVSVDSSATTLSGYAGRFTFNKQKGRMMLNAALGFVSPGFEPGDLGFVSKTDVINYHIATGYKWNDPTEYYRYINIYGSYFGTLDFGGYTRWRGIWGGIEYKLPNYHYIAFYYDYGVDCFDNRRTRGGSATVNLKAYEWSLEYDTDSRLDYIGQAYWYASESADGFYHSLDLTLTLRPVSSVSIAIGPGYLFTLDKAKWIDDNNNSFVDPLAVATYGKRYIFAELNQKEFSAQIRINWTLSPTLSFQMFVQPLFSTGDYTNFKELARPRSFDFNVFGKNGSLFADSTFSNGKRKIFLDPDGTGPVPIITMNHPNFDKVEFRANAVLRWEYMPGSTLYLVWTQNRSDEEKIGNITFGPSLGRLSSTSADNILMLKLTYWLGR